MQFKHALCSLAVLSVFFAAPLALANAKTIEVFKLNDKQDAKGIGEKIGTMTFEDSDKGLLIKPDLKGLSAGNHGFHIHQHPSCEGGEKAGKWEAGLAAGDHFDPKNTTKHLGPYGHGHLGDMPYLVVDKAGNSHTQLTAPHLTLALIEGHSIIIHAHGDNYSDKPKPLGGGGARIACGVILPS